MFSMLKKLRILLSPKDKWMLGLLALLTAAGALAEMLAVSSLMPVIAVLTRPELFRQNRFLKILYDFISPANDMQFVLLLSLGVIVFYCAKNLYMTFLIRLQSSFIYRKNAEMASRLFRTYLNAPYRFFQTRSSATLLSCMDQFVNLPVGLLLPLMLVVTESLVLIALVSLLLVFAPLTTLCAAAAVALLGVLTYLPLRKLNWRLGQDRLDCNRRMFQAKTQTFGAVKEIQVGNLQEFFARRFNGLIHLDGELNAKIYVVGQLPRLVIETAIVVLALGILSGLIVCRVASGTVILTLAMLGAAMYRMVPSITRLHYNVTLIRLTLPVFDRIYAELVETPQQQPIPPEAPEVTFRHTLEVRDLSFSYVPGKEVLKHFDLTVRRGESVALTGATGCGKSTLADLLMGLQCPDEGQILCDGVSIFDNLPSWQRRIGYVPQDIYLMEGTLRANVAFGVPENEIDDGRVRECLRLAQIGDLAQTLPQGLHEVLGERGIRLSGGQKQRIGIARALYHDPEVLILDEATSALDDDTEKAFADALRSLAGERTIITIAHRRTTIESCQRQVRLGR